MAITSNLYLVLPANSTVRGALGPLPRGVRLIRCIWQFTATGQVQINSAASIAQTADTNFSSIRRGQSLWPTAPIVTPDGPNINIDLDRGGNPPLIVDFVPDILRATSWLITRTRNTDATDAAHLLISLQYVDRPPDRSATFAQ